jgi:peroxiredoxin
MGEQARLTGLRSVTLSTMATPGVGDTAPDFEVTDTDGQVHKLSQMVTRGPVILAFFPKAFTPG